VRTFNHLKNIDKNGFENGFPFFGNGTLTPLQWTIFQGWNQSGNSKPANVFEKRFVEKMTQTMR
jgi:hypothetical protein